MFRGKRFDKAIRIESTSYKADYQLLSKKDEPEYCILSPREEKILSPHMDLPPLLREFVIKETGRSDVKMKVKNNRSFMNQSRLPKDGEKPDYELVMGLGKPHPTAAILYEGLNV